MSVAFVYEDKLMVGPLSGSQRSRFWNGYWRVLIRHGFSRNGEWDSEVETAECRLLNGVVRRSRTLAVYGAAGNNTGVWRACGVHVYEVRSAPRPL